MRVRVSLIDPVPPNPAPPDHLPRAVIAEPGKSVWLGRAPAATLCVPDDGTLDDRHVLIVCYAAACRLFAASSQGVVVDGAAVSEALLRDGSVVRVGATVARVDRLPDERAPAGPQSDPAVDRHVSGPPEAPPAHVAAALRVLRRAPAPLYAILDAARRAPGLYRALAAQELMAAIPDDVEELDYADAAPYLVRLAPESALLGQLIEGSWGRMECTFLTSERPFAALRTYLRDLMDARVDDGTPDGRRVLFRFYDPVVLARILSHPGVDAARFFGPVRAWFVEARARDAQRDPDWPAAHGGAGDVGTPSHADMENARDRVPADADDAWLESPGPGVVADPPPTMLLEFRPQRVVPPVGGAATNVRVAVTCRAHDLLAPGTPG